jgi:antitoxin (DNA-binding transcriptional repressor) of toxin-antitoxin stability system
MNTVDVGHAQLDDCIVQSQSEPVVLTRGGVPIAAIVSLNGLDEEQIELGLSSEFWNLIESRRQQQTITQQELERRLAASD